jgi:hypothetical protein
VARIRGTSADVWGLIFYAQHHVRHYTAGLNRVNIIALAANLGFIVLHMLQTQIFYDGLAQDVSIYSSQGSVILLLVVVLAMENRRALRRVCRRPRPMLPGPSMRPNLLDRVAAICSSGKLPNPSKDARDSTKARRFWKLATTLWPTMPDYSS